MRFNKSFIERSKTRGISSMTATFALLVGAITLGLASYALLFGII